MTIYYILYSLIFISTEFCKRTDGTLPQRQRRTAAIPVILLILVLGLRHPSMGVDLQYGKVDGYLWSFETIPKYSWHELLQLGGWRNYEWGYIFYNKILSYISTSDQWLLLVSAGISLLPLAALFARKSRDIEFSYIIYMGLPCFLLPFSGLRQAIAIGICVLATPSICDKNWKRFLIIVLIATLFHSSAVIYLLAYPLYYLRLPKDYQLLMVPLLLVIYMARYPIFSVASKLFKKNAVPDDNGAFALFLVFIMIFIFCQVYCRSDDESSIGFMNIFYFACICQCFGGVFDIAMRLGYYFMPSLAVALPNILVTIPNQRDRRLLQYTIFAIFVIYGLYALSVDSWQMSNPYHFFWEEF